MIRTKRARIVPFQMEHLGDYTRGFDREITRFQWPEPFASQDDARKLLGGFMEEMAKGETLLFSILSQDGAFLGSSEVHGLKEDCPELGVWIVKAEQNNGYAYEALGAVLDYVRAAYGKRAFFYEADIRNGASVALLRKFADRYDIEEREIAEMTTETGKDLKLQGFILQAKDRAMI